MESPTYYNRGNIQVWDFVRDQDLNYHLGNALKYICRAGYKDDKISDLKKAIHYLTDELQHETQNQTRDDRVVPFSVWDNLRPGEDEDAEIFDR